MRCIVKSEATVRRAGLVRLVGMDNNTDHVITIRPLQWHWCEWRERSKASHEIFRKAIKDGPIAAAQALGVWQQELDAWLRTFNEDKQRDVVELLCAESDMLREVIDPSHGAHYMPLDAFSDFRERFYDAVPLLRAAERCHFVRVEVARREYDQLEQFAMERQWLP